MPSDQTTRIPHVPVRSPMYENGRLTRPWIIFFERLWPQPESGDQPPTGGTEQVYHRTLLLKDSTIGDDIADHVTAYKAGTAVRIVGVLRVAITSDLTVRVKKNGSTMVTITIPAATAVDTPVEQASFTLTEITEDDVFSWDVTASDEQVDAAGVASFTLEWQ